MRQRSILPVLALAAAIAVAAAIASARTQTFLETNPDQFDKGETDGVVSTSAGTLRLGRALDSLLAETEGVDYVARLAEAPDGTVYAVTGGAGRIYRVKGDKADLFATLDDHYLFSVLVDQNGDLYVGSGGTKGRIWRVAAQKDGQPKAEVVYEDDGVKYVWDMAWLKDGRIAVATGDSGKLLAVAPGKKAEVLIDSEADHVLCVAVAADGTLYAGTDGEAVVYRWAAGKPFLLYDADEAEITSLALDADGTLYVGASSTGAGRQGGVTIKPPAAPPAAPAPVPSDGATSPPPGEAKEGDAEKPAEASPTSTALAKAVKVAETMQAARPTGAKGKAAAPAAGGSAVYRITPDGLVSPLFDARDAMVLALAATDGRLLVGTGGTGRVYEVALAAGADEEQACIATIDPKQVMALLVSRTGRALVASADPGRVYALSKGYAREGTYTSQVYDAGGSATWGALAWRGVAPAGTEAAVATRSGNVREPEKGMWSDWSKPATKSPARVASPPARFLQFRVTMKTNRAEATPVLDQFEAAYLRANQPPKILSVEEVISQDRKTRAEAVERFRQAVKGRSQNAQKQGAMPQPPPPEGSQPIRVLKWTVQDPNGDTLRYAIHYRSQGEPNWVRLADDLAGPEYAWDTATVADGWYELLVVASDALDHPAETACQGRKISDPILVDNTAPVIEEIAVKVGKDGDAEVRFAGRDATSRLSEAAYTIDSADQWQTLAPADGLFDAPQEAFRFTIKGLKAGPHRLAIRVADEANNRGHAARTVIVPEN